MNTISVISLAVSFILSGAIISILNYSTPINGDWVDILLYIILIPLLYILISKINRKITIVILGTLLLILFVFVCAFLGWRDG